MATLSRARPGVPHLQTNEPFAVTRHGIIMEPREGDPIEAGGVLNPGAARGPDGKLYLFPRLVAEGNYSRIGIARVVFDDEGDPVGVERLGIALEPEMNYEKNDITGGGVEDPRVTFIPALRRYFMTYTAYSQQGPRIALAASTDVRRWQRLGLVRFGSGPIDFNEVDNKDAVIFPALIPNPEGTPSIGLIHRPLFPGTKPDEVLARTQAEAAAKYGSVEAATGPRFANGLDPYQQMRVRLRHQSLWLSYCPPFKLEDRAFEDHHRLLSPRASWERIKVGAGAPPVLTRHGWLLIYHGVGGRLSRSQLHYSAGAAVLDSSNPRKVLFRSQHPVLTPGAEEHVGVVPNVVFPTGIDQRTDLNQPDRLDVYFGMADDRIGVATVWVPRSLPREKHRQQRVA